MCVLNLYLGILGHVKIFIGTIGTPWSCSHLITIRTTCHILLCYVSKKDFVYHPDCVDHNNYYLITTVCNETKTSYVSIFCVAIVVYVKEGNDALNTFYLLIYGIRHMVKDHSDS